MRKLLEPDTRLIGRPEGPAMADAVRELFRHDSVDKGLSARRYVESHYSWDSVVTGLLEHYHAVLGHSVAVHDHA